ncbi:protein SENSITIVE TO UV 2 isoform X1 [Syzygium oleosum]|uniref:protein SENSITIVE TO UV 2 isoform X1 n=1 Tax=Syzygium oleosum TaxID=219896 RepID=UPI0024BB2784|nr:protein SENSITIVE TO UV 2 isoform X1 [Syzygium oleosum]
MTMDEDGEGFEEWDADFLDQVIQVEERALSSANPSQTHPQTPSPLPPPATYLPPPPRPPPPRPRQLLSAAAAAASASASSSSSSLPYVASVSYSPPRELSQRPANGAARTASALPSSPSPASRSGSFEEFEIESLKAELGYVRKECTYREPEHAKFRKERGRKEEQLKSVSSRDGGRLTDNHSSKRIGLDQGVPTSATVVLEVENAKSLSNQASSQTKIESTSKTVGVQTDEAGETTGIQFNNDLYARRGLSRKLLSVWSPSLYQNAGRSLLPKLYVACHSLFRCMGIDVSSKIKMDSLADGSSTDFSWLCHPYPLTASEAAKMSKFHSVFTKVNNGVSQLEALIEPLFDLCHLDNVNIIHRSLCILHLILKHLCSEERKCGERENITVEGLLSKKSFLCICEYGSGISGHPLSVNWDERSYSVYGSRGLSSSGPEIQLMKSHSMLLFSFRDWASVFELMRQLVQKNTEECIRVEAVSIMNLILLRGSAYEHREKFGCPLVLESISTLLKKESGLCVQEQALHLLFLLLNSPKILETFFCGFKNRECSSSMDGNDDKNITIFRGSDVILEGLADCVSSRGSGIQDLKLQRRATMLLAFLASSGTTGFEILMNHKLSSGANFLMLILQALISEMDAEAGGPTEPPEFLKERSLLMREALILLNRLVSKPVYSASLQMLTNSRDMACLTITVANRMSQRNIRITQLDSMHRQMRESEVIELGRAFKRRVYAYLGDHVS